jgi:hypothetical protein
MRIPQSQSEIVVGLDLGTTKVSAVVGEVDADGITILGVGNVPCRGLRKGVVSNIDWTVRSIAEAIEGAQTMAGVEIRTVYAGVAGSHIRCQTSDGVAAILVGEVTRVDVEGTLAWVAAGDTDAPSGPPRGLRLLPYFDAYVVGCQPRELLFPGRAAERALAGGQAGNFPVLLIDGVVAGVWHQRRSGRKIAITVEPLEELSAAQRRALDDQVERVGAILEGTARLSIGSVSVGPHA